MREPGHKVTCSWCGEVWFDNHRDPATALIWCGNCPRSETIVECNDCGGNLDGPCDCPAPILSAKRIKEIGDFAIGYEGPLNETDGAA